MADSTAVKYAIGIDDRELRDAAKRVEREFGEMSKSAVNAGTKIDEEFKKIGKAIAGYFSIQTAANFAKQIVNVRQEVQALEISFSTLLGSSDRAAALLKDLKEFAVSTPLQLNDLAKGAQTLLSFDVAAEKVMPTLKAIGDISMGDAQKLQSLTLAFSQMSSTGRLMGQDLLQMINAGFNPLTEISKQTGKSVAELKEEMSKGAISAQMVADAFMSATSEGGKFYNMLGQQSKSVQGSFSNLQGAIYDMMNELGEKIQGPLSATLNTLMNVVKSYERLGKVAADIVITYGAYKAAVMAVTVAEKLRYQATLAQMAGLTKMQAITTVLKEKTAALNKTMLANPYVAAATAIAAMAVAVWRLYRNQTEAERAQKKFNRELERHKASVDTAVSTYDFFLAKLNAAKKGTDEYAVAVKNISDEYGDYLEKLGIEADKLQDLKSKQEQLRNEIMKTAKMKAKSAMLQGVEEQYNDMIANSREVIRKSLSKLYKEGSKEYVDAYNKILKAIDNKKFIGLSPDANKDMFEGSGFDAFDKNKTAILAAIYDIQKAGAVYEKQVNSVLTVMDVADDMLEDRLKNLRSQLRAAETKDEKAEIQRQIDELTKQKQVQTVKNKKYWEDQIKTLTAQREALENSAENQKEINRLEAEMLKAQAEVDKYDPKKAAKADTTLEDEAAKQRKAQEKVAKMRKAYNESKKEDELNAERNAEQARISIMEEGTQKRLDQIELDYKKQDDIITRKEKDMVEKLRDLKEEEWEAANPDKVKKGYSFDRESVSADMLDDTQKAQIDAMKKANEAARDHAIRTANEEKAALLAEYTDLQTKIEAVKKKYDKLRKEAAGDDTVTANINKAQRKEIADLIMDTFRADEALGKLAEQVQSLGRSARGVLFDRLYKILQWAQKKRTGIFKVEDTAEFAKLVDVSEEFLNNLLSSDEAIAEFGKKVKEIGDTKPIDNLKQAVEAYRKAVEKAKSGEVVDIDNLEHAKQTLYDMVRALSDNVLNELLSIGDALRDIGQTLNNRDLEVAGDALNDVVTNIQAAEAGAQAWGGWWGAIIGGLTDLIPKIVKWATYGGRELEELERSISDFEKSIDYYKRIADAGGSWEAPDYYGNAEKALEIFKEMRKEANKLPFVSNKRNREIVDNIKQLREEYNAMMDGVKSISADEAYRRVVSAYDGKIEELKKKIDQLSAMPKLNADKIRDAYRELGEVIQEQAEYMLQYAESIVGVSSDQLFSDITSMISDAFDAGKDSVDDFEAYYNKMVRNMIKTNVMKSVLENILSNDIRWMSEAMTSYLNGNIDADQLAGTLQYIGQDMQRVTDETLEALKGLSGLLDSVFPDMDEIEASSRGIAAASQDSIDELNGRMTVIQANTVALVESSALCAANTASILSSVVMIQQDTGNMRSTLAEIKTNVAQISKNLSN